MRLVQYESSRRELLFSRCKGFASRQETQSNASTGFSLSLSLSRGVSDCPFMRNKTARDGEESLSDVDFFLDRSTWQKNASNF
jgi:hypothetical protein